MTASAAPIIISAPHRSVVPTRLRPDLVRLGMAGYDSDLGNSVWTILIFILVLVIPILLLNIRNFRREAAREVLDENYALEQDELDKGYVLTCQSVPTSEGVALSYDA